MTRYLWDAAVFLIAGLIQFVEYYGATPSQQCPEEGCINFWDAFYFTIVTVCIICFDVQPLIM